MARRLQIQLTPAQRTELLAVRRQHPKAYIRERAAAILQVAEGKTVREVARQGLIRPRQDETVSSWVHRYLLGGIAQLEVRKGAGRPSKAQRAQQKQMQQQISYARRSIRVPDEQVD